MLRGIFRAALVTGAILLFSVRLFGQPEPFVSFELQPAAGCAVLIRWEVAASADSLSFEIERSSDNQNWKVIEYQHNAPSHKYLVADTNPLDSLNYYRVRQISKSSSVVSTIKCIQLIRAFEIFIWPNPSTEVLYVFAPFLKGSIDIYDSNGLLVRKIIIINFTTAISTIGLTGGTYFLHIKHGELYTVQKFIKE